MSFGTNVVCVCLFAYFAYAIYIYNKQSVQSIGRLTVEGSELKIYSVGGGLAVEPRISFGEICNPIMYNNLYLKYQLTLPLNIDVNSGQVTVTVNSQNVVRIEPTKLAATVNEALASADSQVKVFAELLTKDKPYKGQLVFLCNTYERCEQLKDEINSHPRQIQMAIKFDLFCRVNENPVKFGEIISANLPRISCNSSQWIVFQKRVDGSVSFAKNWEAYEKGFGNSESNYWMGLRQLSAMTVMFIRNANTKVENWMCRCQLRIEVEDLNGTRYWGEYMQFQVLGPEHDYTLLIGDEVSDSQLNHFAYRQNNVPFSTFDRGSFSSNSKERGYAGWWHIKNIYSFTNPNGPYTEDIVNEYSKTYASFCRKPDEKCVLVKSSLMMFRCS